MGLCVCVCLCVCARLYTLFVLYTTLHLLCLVRYTFFTFTLPPFTHTRSYTQRYQTSNTISVSVSISWPISPCEQLLRSNLPHTQHSRYRRNETSPTWANQIVLVIVGLPWSVQPQPGTAVSAHRTELIFGHTSFGHDTLPWILAADLPVWCF